MLEIFLSVMRRYGVVDDGFHLIGIGDHVGGDVAAVEHHAFDDLGCRSRRSWISSTVMTPSE
jgi:hypothetical protein